MVVLKIKLNDDTRRITLQNFPSFQALIALLKQLYGASLHSDFLIKYEDDDKDMVTISSDLELKEAFNLATSGTLRLFLSNKSNNNEEVPVDGLKKETPTKTPELSFLDQLLQSLFAQGPAVPELLKDNNELVQKILAHPGASEFLALVAPQLSSFLSAVPQENQPKPENKETPREKAFVHYKVMCDGCGKTPIVGTRFKCAYCHNFDLCEECEPKRSSIHDASHSFHAITRPVWSRRNWHHNRPSSETAEGSTVHQGIVCDGCQASPIVGIRYKCTICPDFDLCESCKSKPDLHNQSHMLLKIVHPRTFNPNAPTYGRPTWGSTQKSCPRRQLNNQASHPLSRFVADVTVADASQISPGHQFTKVWRLRNVGEAAWPAGTVLAFVGGDRLSSTDQVPIPNVNPEEEIDIAVEMQAPIKPGRYVSYWRLASNGNRFGHRVWVDFTVPILDAPNEIQTEKVDLGVDNFEVISSPKPEPQEGLKIEVQSVSHPFVAQEPVVQTEKKEEPLSDELCQLKEMGFTDIALNQSLLNKNGNDVVLTIQDLINM